MKKLLVLMCLSVVLMVVFFYYVVVVDFLEIEKFGILKVVMEDDYVLFNFMNNGQVDGFNKDMFEELCKYVKFYVDQSILLWIGLLVVVFIG